MNRLLSLSALLALALAPSFAKAADITYTFDQTVNVDTVGSYTVDGTLTTDGTIGALTASNILSFDLNVGGVAYAVLDSASGATVSVTGSSLTATAQDLSFNFGGFYDSARFIGQGRLDLAYNEGVTGASIGIFGATPDSDVIATVAPAATPEPSSFVLLGTGALGLAGAVRRRFVK